MSIIPHVGDFVIESGAFGFGIYKVHAVKEKTASYVKYGARTGRIRFEDIVFSGSEIDARRLHEQLKSSRALENEDRNKASDRGRRREQEFIAKAISSALNPDEAEEHIAENRI